MKEAHRTSQHSHRRGWLVCAGLVIGLMMFGSTAWAHGEKVRNETRVASADSGPVGSRIEVKALGGELRPGQPFQLTLANAPLEECHHGSAISSQKEANARGNVRTSGVIPQRSPGTYTVCFSSTDNTFSTPPAVFTVE